MGATGIQLAVAAGYKVISTAGAHNIDYVKSLGASEVFDRADPDVVDRILESLKGASFAGAYDCISEESTIRACAKISSQLGGAPLATVLPVQSDDLPENVKTTMGERSPPIVKYFQRRKKI